MGERIWRAFWRHKGKPLKALQDGMLNFLEPATRIPFALVAERDGRLCGNLLVIESDEPARPELTPWIAAVWVDEDMRKQGVAAAMLREGIARSGALGIERLYLSSRPAMRGFYTKQAWRPIDEDVGEGKLIVYDYNIPGAPKSVPSIIRE